MAESEFVIFDREYDRKSCFVHRSAIKFIEPSGHGIVLHIDGVGPVRTETYDIAGFASLVLHLDDEEVQQLAA